MTRKYQKSHIVFSTDQNFSYEREEYVETLPPSKQNLRIHLDRRGGGKIVTVVRGYSGDKGELNTLGKELKKKCGVGGSVKNGEILIQGNVREKILKILIEKGYGAKPSGG
ncbi:MAG: translation initiation factor [Candidatus Marinimicrobia bacterium]|nr:translation initiation factor [Candidatus Neomarinimicrobiota bacterium]